MRYFAVCSCGKVFCQNNDIPFRCDVCNQLVVNFIIAPGKFEVNVEFEEYAEDKDKIEIAERVNIFMKELGELLLKIKQIKISLVELDEGEIEAFKKQATEALKELDNMLNRNCLDC